MREVFELDLELVFSLLKGEAILLLQEDGERTVKIRLKQDDVFHCMEVMTETLEGMWIQRDQQEDIHA